VLIVPLQITKPEPDEVSRKVSRQHKKRSEDKQRAPQGNHRSKIESQQILLMTFTASFDLAMMGKVTRSPHRLRKAKQQREVT
jgi:hypothetical protein